LDALSHLTGRADQGEAPFAVGRKFDASGQPLECAGNTLLCHVDETSDVFRALSTAQNALKTCAYAQAFSFLPPRSFHMTIFEGVIDYARDESRWPSGLSNKETVHAATHFLSSRLEGLDIPQRFQLKPTSLRGGVSLRLSGANALEEAKLAMARDDLQRATGIVRPDHASYVFHITLAYLIHWLPLSVARAVQALADEIYAIHLSDCIFDLGPVEFCTFETMHHFERQFFVTADP